MARRHTPEQVIAKVRQGQEMLNDRRPMVEVIKELQVTEATWYRWLNQYGSEKNAEASKRTKELEKENSRHGSRELDGWRLAELRGPIPGRCRRPSPAAVR